MLLVLASLPLEAETLAVLYPEVEEPYLSVFRAIAAGVARGNDGEVKLYRLARDSQVDEIRAWLKQEKIDAAVSLGNRGFQFAPALAPLPVVLGGLPVQPGTLSGVSLVPDPGPLFESLRKLAPGVAIVHVVYGPSSAWLIPRAEAAAKALGLTLDARPVGDLKAAVLAYAEILKQAQGTGHGIWLAADPLSSNDQVVLPLVLKAAWDQSFVVFSSIPAHLKRGALFAAIPDNMAMGERLAALALDTVRHKGAPQVVPAAKLGLAVNLRTADHLELHFSPQQEREFQLVFPPR